MSVKGQIEDYIASLPELKSKELLTLHRIILEIKPDAKLWFLDGKDDKGKVVTNPNIGYGAYTIKYAGGKTREFYQVGLSANTTGISVYIMGIEDKRYLAKTYGEIIGKASVSGYCIKFKTLDAINIDVLKSVIIDRFQDNSNK